MTDTRVCIDAISALLDVMGWNKGPEIFIQGALSLKPDVGLGLFTFILLTSPQAVTHMSPIYIDLQSLMYWIFDLRGFDSIPIGLTSLDHPHEVDRGLDVYELLQRIASTDSYRPLYSKHRLCTLGRLVWTSSIDARAVLLPVLVLETCFPT